MDLYPLFMADTYYADISKAYGGTFAVIQMFHLMRMALMGGMVLVGDLRLLNILLKDLPSEMVIENTHKWFGVSLTIMIMWDFHGSAVAMTLLQLILQLKWRLLPASFSYMR